MYDMPSDTPVEPLDLETVVRNIDARLTKVEQILPTLATKEQLRALATKEQLKALATKEDLNDFVRREDLRDLPTRSEMHAAIAAAIAPLATKAELAEAVADLSARIAALGAEMREEAERSRRYMQMLYESLKDEIRILSEGLIDARQRCSDWKAQLTRELGTA